MLWVVQVEVVAFLHIGFAIFVESVLKSQCRPTSEQVRKAYYLHFGCRVGDQDKCYAPHVCNVSFNIGLVNR